MPEIKNMDFELQYSILQVALDSFDKLPEELDETQSKKAQTIATKKCQIQQKVLETSEARHVIIPEDQVGHAISQIIERFDDEESFENQLQKSGLDFSGFKEAISRELRVDAVLEKIAAEVPGYSEVDAKIYYYMNQDKFSQPEIRDVRHILITINEDFDENKREPAYQRAESISERLQKKPQRFAEQAQKHSECPTAMEGGVIGRVKHGVLFPELEEVVFNMSEGEVSGVVESSLGFHVMYCEKIQKAGVVPVGQAIPKIVEAMDSRNKKRRQKEWINQLFSKEA